MINAYEEAYGFGEKIKKVLETEGLINLFPIILKESHKLVADLMKIPIGNKNSQLCLQKVLKAIQIVALINGYL